MSTSHVPTLTSEQGRKKRIGLWLILTPTVVILGTNSLLALYTALAVPEGTANPHTIGGYTALSTIVIIANFLAALLWLPSLIVGIVFVARKPKKAVDATLPTPPSTLLK